MQQELSPFSKWALAEERTVAERYLILEICDACSVFECRQRPPEQRGRIEHRLDYKLKQHLMLNPLDLPPITAADTEMAARFGPELEAYGGGGSCSEPALGEAGEVLRFFPSLENVSMGFSTMRDISFIESLPHLKSLGISSGDLEDLSPLRSRPELRHLRLTLNGGGPPMFAPPVHWLDASPLGALTELESLSFGPNPAVLRGLSFPKVTSATLWSEHCVQPDCDHLPEMPALRQLTLSGVQSLRGISRFTQLRHIIVSGPLRDFGDIAALPHLDCLEVNTDQGWPRSVAPLAKMPALMWVSFGGEIPRNYWPLAGAPRLRGIEVPRCPTVALEIQAVQAALPPWGELFGQPEPRPLPPLRFVHVSSKADRKHLPSFNPPPDPDWTAHPKRFELELRWMQTCIMDSLREFLGSEDGFHTDHSRSTWKNRQTKVEIETLDVALKLPGVLDAIRRALAFSPHPDWEVCIYLNLRLHFTDMTDQQKKWLKQIEDRSNFWDDEFDHEKYQAKQRHIIDTQFLLRTSAEEGEKPDEEDFVPPPILKDEPGSGKLVSASGPAADEDDGDGEVEDDYALKPFDEQDQDNSDGDDASGGVTTAPSPTPPPDFWDDPYAHPLSDSYRFWAKLTFDTFYHTLGNNLATVCQLMGRRPDECHYGPDEHEGS